MMYSNFNEWRDEMNRIAEKLNRATPQEMMKELIRSQRDEVQNNIIRLRNELNKARTTTTLTAASYNFGRDEKGRIMFNAKQAVRATIDSYKLNWFQYIWNLIDYKHAEHYILKKIEKRANKGLDWIEFSELKWPFDKFPELVERLQFLGFKKILSSSYYVHCFSWKEEGITTLKY